MATVIDTLVMNLRGNPNMAGFNQVENRLDGIINRFNAIGNAMLKLGTLGAGAGAMLARRAMETDKIFTQIETLTGLTGKQVDILRGKMKQLSSATGAALDEVSNAAFFSASAGNLQLDTLMRQVRVATQMNKLMLGPTQDLTRLLASITEVYGKAGGTLTNEQAADMIVAAVREGTAEPSELGKVLPDVLDFSRQVGVAFDEILAVLAFASRAGTPLPQLTTSIQSFYQGFIKSRPTAEKLLEELTGGKLTYDDFVRELQERGLISVARTLNEVARRDAGNAADLLGHTQSLKIFQRIVGDPEGAMATWKAVKESQGALEEGYKIWEATPAAKYEKAMNRVALVFREIGFILLPKVTKVMDRFLAGMKYLEELKFPWKEQLAGLLTYAPVILVMGAAIRTASFALSGFNFLWRRLAWVLAPGGRVAAGLRTVVGLSTRFLGVFGLIAGTIIGFVAKTWNSWKYWWDGFTKAIEPALNELSIAWDRLLKENPWIGHIWESIFGKDDEFEDKVGEFAEFGNAGARFGRSVRWMISLLAEFVEGLTTTIDTVKALMTLLGIEIPGEKQAGHPTWDASSAEDIGGLNQLGASANRVWEDFRPGTPQERNAARMRLMMERLETDPDKIGAGGFMQWVDTLLRLMKEDFRKEREHIDRNITMTQKGNILQPYREGQANFINDNTPMQRAQRALTHFFGTNPLESQSPIAYGRAAIDIYREILNWNQRMASYMKQSKEGTLSKNLDQITKEATSDMQRIAGLMALHPEGFMSGLEMGQNALILWHESNKMLQEFNRYANASKQKTLEENLSRIQKEDSGLFKGLLDSPLLGSGLFFGDKDDDKPWWLRFLKKMSFTPGSETGFNPGSYFNPELSGPYDKIKNIFLGMVQQLLQASGVKITQDMNAALKGKSADQLKKMAQGLIDQGARYEGLGGDVENVNRLGGAFKEKKDSFVTFGDMDKMLMALWKYIKGKEASPVKPEDGGPQLINALGGGEILRPSPWLRGAPLPIAPSTSAGNLVSDRTVTFSFGQGAIQVNAQGGDANLIASRIQDAMRNQWRSLAEQSDNARLA